MNQKQLEKKVKYWQDILKLNHWDITCGFYKGDEIEDRIGMCSIQGEYFRGHIMVQNPNHFYNKKEFIKDELDRIIIHELLHCHLSSITHGEGYKGALQQNEERVITLLEKAFYDLWAGEAV